MSAVVGFSIPFRQHDELALLRINYSHIHSQAAAETPTRSHVVDVRAWIPLPCHIVSRSSRKHPSRACRHLHIDLYERPKSRDKSDCFVTACEAVVLLLSFVGKVMGCVGFGAEGFWILSDDTTGL